MWFKKLTGFDEISPENVRENITIDGTNLISKVNNKSYQFGSLEIPTLQELAEQARAIDSFNDKIKITEIVENVQKLHVDPRNKDALFQAASQFNLLEMAGFHMTPEMGVSIYEYDFTQGPACAIACGVGTIYRNYFVPLNGQTGQTADNQIDCLEDIGNELNNKERNLWDMRNGYALLNRDGLLDLNAQLHELNNTECALLKGKLKVGLQWETEVTIAAPTQLVSQIYCAALPVAYSTIPPKHWEKLARIILEATYEATFYAALINLEKRATNKVYLTLVGGGAFGNNLNWILESLLKAIDKFKNTPLDVKIVSYKNSNRSVQKLLKIIQNW